jgi:hypothetical protein
MVLVYASTVRGQQFRAAVQMRNTLERPETNTDPFSRSIDAALDRSRFNNTDLEDQANALVNELEFATERLKEPVDGHIVNNFDVNQVPLRGMYLDMFILRPCFSPAAEPDVQF